MTDFAATKAMFDLPEGVIYLDGNSLGPLPSAAKDRVANMMTEEWGKMLITGWNKAGWMQKSTAVGNRIARLIGAEEDHVIMGDTLSIKVYQAVASALEMNPSRKVVLSDNGNFPSDLYIVQGLLKSLGAEYELRVVDPEVVAENITDDVAVLMLTEVDYRTGRKHDMKTLTAKAHEAGALTVWDLAHSAGALPVDLAGCKADFAVGCTYKYLNSGPGGPAFIYVAPRHAEVARPALSGWLGHEAPFAFELDYRPGRGIERMRVGTPPVIQLTSLEAAMDIWDQVDMQDLRAKSIELCDLFIAEVEAACPELELASPRDGDQRGSQVSFRFREGYAAMQALIERGVIGDFRAPDIMRFGFTPLYIDADDVRAAVAIVKDVMTNDLWDNDAYKQRAAVT
ncbi:kynureninase [Phaeobacter gallaeciensis]|uniref:Kynureninase n=1 Tax=Phaeobacter gallaeciensis TaxID=60890 RepID=A0A1B0ZWB4_9RHOB|nr:MULTISPECIES: kynureninase [Phaeobacter]MDF1770633.1 kynureninase [Pseudophaeobacter sp. bin_em_oilr2.035]MEE2634344.1 kynureninase [Pseudomonadota bacterium]ANP38428.1 kynureninase [Phaeobacter gallaeciensis]MDE4060234.1 kynureninase [Phaeobacter gallaeciensis]MDE4123253.1 kynureninase [Phaeobacter gallaeciensis]